MASNMTNKQQSELLLKEATLVSQKIKETEESIMKLNIDKSTEKDKLMDLYFHLAIVCEDREYNYCKLKEGKTDGFCHSNGCPRIQAVMEEPQPENLLPRRNSD